MKRFSKLLRGVFVVGVLSMTACSRSEPGLQGPQMEAAARGRAVYLGMCAQCHDAGDLHLLKQPPKLKGLFRGAALPSGAPATDAEVEEVIIHGRRTMPAFDQVLSDSQVDDLVKYLHTL